MKTFFLFVALCGVCFGQLDVAVINISSDVDQVRYQMREVDFERITPIRFFQAESVQFNVAAMRARNPVILTAPGVTVRWEAYAELGSTNAFIHKPGVVWDASSGVARIELTPEEANLPAGIYYSYVRAFQEVGGSNQYIGVLAYNRLEVLWSPDASVYSYQGPFPVPDLSGAIGPAGPAGADGISAYAVAVTNGFVGDAAAWLASLVGAAGTNGVDGVDGIDGISAYAVAVTNGFVGDAAAWLASLVGAAGTNGVDGVDGIDGISAYAVAVTNGFVGDEAAWLASLVGPSGTNGVDGVDGSDGQNSPWNVSTDTAWLTVGTNTIWIYAEPNPTDTNYTAVGWIVSPTNATLLVGTNTVELLP